MNTYGAGHPMPKRPEECSHASLFFDHTTGKATCMTCGIDRTVKRDDPPPNLRRVK